MRAFALFQAALITLPMFLIACGDSSSAGPGGSGTTTPSGGGGGDGGDGGGGTGGGSSSSTNSGGEGGGAIVCNPGETLSCYTGPAGTEGVGLCKAGKQTCKANGEGYGECADEVTPVAETCDTSGDDDCDGMINEEGRTCQCTPGDVAPCYSGPMGTLGVGVCLGGTQTCNVNGAGFGACMGEVLPTDETCLTIEDDDCDGLINEEGTGCACLPGSTKPCYTGPLGSEGIGVCVSGVSFCNASGTAFGSCLGEVVPQPETCLSMEDDDCDGLINEEGIGCVCAPGSLVPCYTGPAGTLGVGGCLMGTAPCNAEGTGFGGCEGEIIPQTETCLLPGDEDCDGLVNEDGEGCSCTPGTTKPCYSGPADTENVGTCKAGSQTCLADGSAYGACLGEVVPAVEICSTQANEDCQLLADCGGQIWSKRIGGTGDQKTNQIARDSQNNVFVTGSFAGTFTTGGNPITSAGGYDVFVVKLDPSGTTLWAKRFGDANIYQEALDVAVDNIGNVYVTGYFEGTIPFGATVLTSAGATDAFLAKLDPNGNTLWAKRFGGTGAQYGQSLAVDAQGNVTLIANGFNTMDFGGGVLTSAGDYDMFLARFDPAGNLFWQKRFGGVSADIGQNIAADALGNLVFTGKTDGPIDFGGGALVAAGSLDAIVVKLDPLGAFFWDKRFGDGGNQFGVDIATDAQNDIFITGGFEGTINLGGGALSAVGPADVYIGKLTAVGGHVLSKRFGAMGVNLSVLSLTSGAFGDVFFVGQVDGPINFGGGALTPSGALDAFAVRLDVGFGHAWSRRFGAAGNQYGLGSARTIAGELLLTGYFEQTIDFGGGALSSLGGLDTFVAKLAP